MSLTTRMLAPIALIMSIALAFVAGSAYDNAKKNRFIQHRHHRSHCGGSGQP